MPIQDVSVKSNWTTDKVIEPLAETNKLKSELGPGIYNANIDQSEPYHFNNAVRKVAVVGAGPAGVSMIILYSIFY